MKIDSKRYEEIKNKVVSMYESYDIRCVPVNGFEIAMRMNIKVIPYSSFPIRIQKILMKKSMDGFSSLDSNGIWKIFYNDNISYERMHNTILHEIGHIVLDHSEDSELAEAEVNFFAKFALAPPVLVHKLNCRNYLDISSYFEISFEAAKYAWDYYQKWLKYAKNQYLSCDIRIWNQFDTRSCKKTLWQ